MIKINSKGQGAMEYLMTYAWAILVVVIIGIVLYQMGVFNSGQGAAVTTGFPQIKPLSQAIVYKAANGTFEASFINTLGTGIQLTDINMTDVMMNSPCTITTPSPIATSVAAGDSFKIIGTCLPKQSKESYSVHISLAYNVAMENIISRTEDGTIQGQTE